MLAYEAFLSRHELFPYGFSSRVLVRTHWHRLGVKLLGFAFTLAPIGVAYWVFPIYREGEGTVIWSIFQIVGLPVLLISPVYIWFTDVQMERPEDGLYMAGLAVLGDWDGVDRYLLSQHALGWLVKGYFAPLMLSYTIGDLNWLLSPAAWELAQQQPFGWYQFGYRFLFFIDLVFGDIGYFCTLRLFNTHIRSTDRTGLGWAVCLACYPPFWFMIRSEYLAYWDVDWPGWVGSHTTLGLIWAILITVVASIVVWSDTSFGLRFSNLAYRGLLTNGPYR